MVKVGGEYLEKDFATFPDNNDLVDIVVFLLCK